MSSPISTAGTTQCGPSDSRLGTATRSEIEIAMKTATASTTVHRDSTNTRSSAGAFSARAVSAPLATAGR